MHPDYKKEYRMTDSNQGERPTVGVVEELARDDVQRKHFLKMAGKGMGSAAGTSTSAAMGGTGTAKAVASTSAPSGDLAIVNYALTLEYLESQFYAKVIASGLFHGKNLSVLKSFGAEETQHVVALKKVAMSMGAPAQEPMGKFPIHSATQVTKLAG